MLSSVFSKTAKLLLIPVAVAMILLMPNSAAAQNCPAGQQQVSVAIPGVSVQIATPAGGFINCVPAPAATSTLSANPIVAFLIAIINFLVIGIGLAAVGGLITGGILYLSARGNAQQVQKAEEIIRNTIIGLALYVFMVVIINFIIPGGILGGTQVRPIP